MQITQKGQVTIPEHIRKKYGFLPHTNVDFVEEKGKVFIVLLNKKHQNRGKSIVSHLKGKATIKMRTDDILALTRKK